MSHRFTVTVHEAAPHGTTAFKAQAKFASMLDAELFIKTNKQLGYYLQIETPRILCDSDFARLASIGAVRN